MTLPAQSLLHLILDAIVEIMCSLNSMELCHSLKLDNNSLRSIGGKSPCTKIRPRKKNLITVECHIQFYLFLNQNHHYGAKL